MALNMRQAIIWANADKILSRINSALGGDKLTLIVLYVYFYRPFWITNVR